MAINAGWSQGALARGLDLVASLLPMVVRPTGEHFVSILHDRFVQGGFDAAAARLEHWAMAISSVSVVSNSLRIRR